MISISNGDNSRGISVMTPTDTVGLDRVIAYGFLILPSAKMLDTE